MLSSLFHHSSLNLSKYFRCDDDEAIHSNIFDSWRFYGLAVSNLSVLWFIFYGMALWWCLGTMFFGWPPFTADNSKQNCLFQWVVIAWYSWNKMEFYGFAFQLYTWFHVLSYFRNLLNYYISKFALQLWIMFIKWALDFLCIPEGYHSSLNYFTLEMLWNLYCSAQILYSKSIYMKYL